MDHFYQSIPGYFSFPDFYAWLAREFPYGKGAEVGSFAGRSAAYLIAELARRLSKSIWPTVSLVDVFDKGGGNSVDEVLSALSPRALEARVKLHVMKVPSVEGADKFDDASLDWVYIDADHTYGAVRADIAAWLPKVRKGGVIAGHDYAPYPTFGVIQAVTEIFPIVEIWRGEIFNGDGVRDMSHDAEWLGRYYPTWCVRI